MILSCAPALPALLCESLHTCSGGSRCLDALTIALTQVHDRGQEKRAWYVSTLELQLASLEFCRACRSVPLLHVRVHSGTPHTLRAPGKDASQRHPWQHTSLSLNASSASAAKVASIESSRVPAVRAACLTWSVGENELACVGGLEQWGELQYLQLSGNNFWSELELMEWPHTLKALTLDIGLAVPERVMSWPVNLQELSLGRRFNQPLSRIVWPASLQQLSSETSFDPSIAGVVWPPSLRQMKFGEQFDQTIAGIVWPVSLQQLSVGDIFDQPIAGVVWPTSLQELYG